MAIPVHRPLHLTVALTQTCALLPHNCVWRMAAMLCPLDPYANADSGLRSTTP